jgi:hypothetical protein
MFADVSDRQCLTGNGSDEYAPHKKVAKKGRTYDT